VALAEAGQARTFPPTLRANREFAIFLGGQTISAVGDSLTVIALPLLVGLLTGSGTIMGVVAALESVPDLLFGLPAGALADRWDRRKMMFWADLGRAGLTALIPVAAVMGLPLLPVVLVVAAPISILRVAFSAAYGAVVPNLVGRAQVARANSAAEAIMSTSWVVGPALAGILSTTIGPGPTLAIDAASFLVSAISLLFIRRPLRGERDGTQKALRHEIADGLRFVWRKRTLRWLVIYEGFIAFINAPLVPAIVFLMTIERGLSAQNPGFVISLFAIGWVIAATIFTRWGIRRMGWAILVGQGVMAAFFAIFAVSTDPLVQAVFAFAAGSAGSVAGISSMTLLATIPPDAMLGRVTSSAHVLSTGLTPLGVLTGGILLDLLGGVTTIVAMSVATLAAVLLFSLSGSLRGATPPLGADGQ
jgi:MFS family permease